MSDFSTTDLVETTRERLEYALRQCGLPLSLHPDAFEVEDTGAWHDAYRITVPESAHPVILRLRKATAYGQPQNHAEQAASWHAKYVSTSLYYRLANRAWYGICPSMFLYHVSPDVTCTVETYMGTRLDLGKLSSGMARHIGQQIGGMMRVMHSKKSHIPGAGELVWDGANLQGTSPRYYTALNRRIEQTYNENILLALTEQTEQAGVGGFDALLVRDKLSAAHRLRMVEEPIVLINRDITPENLTVQPDNRVGIIDPYPYLGNGTRFAAWFIHCYRYLLPAYANTQRHAASHYNQHAATLAHIAEGFESGYVRDHQHLARHINAERWLWLLEQAYDDLERLNTPSPSERTVIKHGTPNVIRTRLRQTLHALETLAF